MQFIINTGHPSLSFSACLLNVAQASFDLYDQIMVSRSQLLAFRTWHHHGELKQLFECQSGTHLRVLNQQFEAIPDENLICTALIVDPQYQEPICLAVFGSIAFLEQYTSQFKRLQSCPARFFIDDGETVDSQVEGTTAKASTTQ